jgi:hypothetical protein
MAELIAHHELPLIRPGGSGDAAEMRINLPGEF